MQNSEYQTGIALFQKILQGDISKFPQLETSLKDFPGARNQLAVFAVFENCHGYPAYSLDTFFNIVDDTAPFASEDVAIRNDQAFCLIALCLLDLKESAPQDRQIGLAKKLVRLLSPFQPDILTRNFHPAIDFRSVVLWLKNLVRRPQQKLEPQHHNFISLIAGDREMPKQCEILVKEFSYTLNFEFEELGKYHGIEEGYILGKSKEDTLDEYQYASGLLFLPGTGDLSSNLVKKIEDKLLRKLQPSAALDLFFYLGERSSQVGIKQLLGQSPDGIGAYPDKPYDNSHRETIVKLQTQAIRHKLAEKQIQCFYHNLKHKEAIARQTKIELLGAFAEAQAAQWGQLQNRGRELVLGEELVHLQTVSLHGIHVILGQGKAISGIFKKFCVPFQPTVSIS